MIKEAEKNKNKAPEGFVSFLSYQLLIQTSIILSCKSTHIYNLESEIGAYLLDHDTSISARSQFVYPDEKYNEMSMSAKNDGFDISYNLGCAQLASVPARLTVLWLQKLGIFLLLNPLSKSRPVADPDP